MEHALQRLSDSVESYASRKQSKSVACIELVSAFKVVCKRSTLDDVALEPLLQAHMLAVLSQLDTGEINARNAIKALSELYAAAHDGDASSVFSLMAPTA